MALFGEEDEETAEEADPPELEDEPGPEASASTDGEAGSIPEEPDEEGEQASPDPANDGAEGGADEGADSDGHNGAPNDIDVEEALKDLSARMSVISSNLEGVQENRDELEDKIGDVEERMSRLGSLAEAVSSEYNPFVSENAPDQPSWTPEPEDGGAGDDPAPPDSPGLAPEDAPEPGEGPDGEQPPEPTAPEPEHVPEPGPDAQEPEGLPQTDPRSLEPDDEPDTSEEPQGTDPLPQAGSDRPTGGHQGDPPGELEENLILLEWVGMLLDRVGRAGLMDLLDYYQNLGWLDRDTKDQVTRVAVGVDAPDRVEDGHWRGDVELHRRSLVAIQRLQGDEIPAARLDELELDLRRLFRE